MKSKLGISVGLVGAMVCFSACFGNYIAAILAAGYVLLFEESEWLKKTAVKAVALMVCVDVFVALVGLIPDLLGWIQQLVALFKGEFSYTSIRRIISIITSAVTICQTALFLLMGVKALNQGTIRIPVVDKLVDKYM